MTKVILKKDRDRAVRRGHPWIFSGAIQTIPKCRAGTILPIFSAEGDFLAQGYFNPDNSLAGRIFTREKGDPHTLLAEALGKALALRKGLFDEASTNAYRLVNGEGDGIPGLIVDVYGDYVVVQIHTSGVDLLRPFFIQQLKTLLSPKGIYEKSLSSVRLEEDLSPEEGILYGDVPEVIEILENGIPFFMSPSKGQKTGFFLDQRSMRTSVEALSKGKRVLSLFSYTGAFGAYALRGGAKEVCSVDISEAACEFAEKNCRGDERHKIIQSDAFDYIEKESLNEDLILVDPPAFAKKRKHLDQALKGYQKLNQLVLKKMRPGSMLMTSSCSYFVDEERFHRAIMQAAQNAGRFVRIIGRHIQAPDHPVSLSHPEGSYLKSLLLFAE